MEFWSNAFKDRHSNTPVLQALAALRLLFTVLLRYQKKSRKTKAEIGCKRILWYNAMSLLEFEIPAHL
jgi:hypothetical protein